MKKILAGIAIVAACLVPMTSASASGFSTGSFCTTGLALNFCGSVDVSVVAAGTGSDVSFKVYNTSGIAGGDAAAVFTAVGLEGISGISSSTQISGLTVQLNGTGTNYGWEVNVNEEVGGGTAIDLLSSTQPGSTINWGISSSCTADNRIDTCGTSYVLISFHTAPAVTLASGSEVFIKAQGLNSSECRFDANGNSTCPTTTVPEPASIVLVGTGLMALGRRANRWRRRNQNV